MSNNKTLHVVALCALVLVALIGYYFISHSNPNLSQDFPGGIQPSNLWTATAATNSVSPLSGTPNIYTTGALSAGGVGTYNQISAYVTASGTPASVVTLGNLGATTSTATTSITVQNTAGLALGAICSGGSSATSTIVSGCLLYSTNGVTGTAIVSYSNILNSPSSVATSTVFRIAFDELPY